MSLLDKIRQLRRRLTGVKDVANHRIWRSPNLSGVYVNEDVANTYSAMWCARRVIGQNIACLSWDVHREMPSGGSEIVMADPAQRIIHRQVNPEMTSFTFREAIIGHALFWGNGYAEIERDMMGRPLRMWLLPPDCVTPERDGTGQIVYRVTGRGGDQSFVPIDDMYHLKGMGFDGLVGHSMVAMARESIGMGLAAERFGSAFYGNDTRPGGILSHPKSLKKEARENVKRELEEVHQGPPNRWKVALFEEGLTWQNVGIPPEDAQYIESRKFQVSEVSRWTGLPPSFLGDWENAKFNNVEQQRMLLQGDAIKPWAGRCDSEGTWKLIGKTNQANRSTKLNVDSLVTTDTETRFKAIAVGRQWGLLSADEGRQMLGLNPLPRGQNGKESIIPQNMGPASKLLEEPKPPPPQLPPPTDDGDGETDADEELMPQRSIAEFKRGYTHIFDDVFTRCLGREKARIDDAPERVRAFWREHKSYVARSITAPAKAFGDLVFDGPSSEITKAVEDTIEDFSATYTQAGMMCSIDARTCKDLPTLIHVWEVAKSQDTAELLVEQLTNACRKASHESHKAPDTA